MSRMSRIRGICARLQRAPTGYQKSEQDIQDVQDVQDKRYLCALTTRAYGLWKK